MDGPIVFKADKRSLEGFFILPEADVALPAVVLIHEIFGLNRNMRAAARRLAQAGYAALAVDLFSAGPRPLCLLETMKNMFQPATDHSGTRALRAALDYLGQQRGVDADRLGALGFCLGGNFALALAAEDRRLKVIAPFYGSVPASIRDFKGFCPVVGSFPAKDYTAAHAERLAAGLSAAEVPHDIKIYPGARHSFANQDMPFYQPQAAEDAWARTLSFLDAHL